MSVSNKLDILGFFDQLKDPVVVFSNKNDIFFNDYFIKKGITINARFFTEIRSLEVDIRLKSNDEKNSIIKYFYYFV